MPTTLMQVFMQSTSEAFARRKASNGLKASLTRSINVQTRASSNRWHSNRDKSSRATFSSTVPASADSSSSKRWRPVTKNGDTGCPVIAPWQYQLRLSMKYDPILAQSHTKRVGNGISPCSTARATDTCTAAVTSQTMKRGKCCSIMLKANRWQSPEISPSKPVGEKSSGIKTLSRLAWQAASLSLSNPPVFT